MIILHVTSNDSDVVTAESGDGRVTMSFPDELDQDNLGNAVSKYPVGGKVEVVFGPPFKPAPHDRP